MRRSFFFSMLNRGGRTSVPLQIGTSRYWLLIVCVRANFSEIFSSNVATHGLMGSWLKK